MKFVLCCPECGNENLDFKEKSNPNVLQCTDSKCNHIFTVEQSGYNTQKKEK